MTAVQSRPLIVGMSCRVPGARGLVQVWDALSQGRCTVGQVDDRLFDPALFYDPHRTRRGKAYSFAAGQLENLHHFDANFFGINPRAAAEMEPQQRLMLTSVWEAVEDSGLDIADLAGDRTGVFIGASLVEMLPKYYLDPARGGSNFVLGNTLSVIANRISSVFDFGGPSYVLDTACSSSLYALHQAADAITSGALDTAIVGGVHVVRTPGGFVGFSQARMLSPTGLCHAFDAAADGYVRSEACATVVLMHPDKVKKLGPRVRARVLATAVNSDGAARQLTVPSAARQEMVIASALYQSGRDPEDIDFYEAHGTGTQVGDQAEATGLGEALGKLRRDPLPIGSAKTNFGHAEPAAGLVGLSKALLAIQHRRVPKSLHFNSPNPDIDFEDLNLRVLDQEQDLSRDGPVLAGVSSFGFGGTNAAALISSADEADRKLYPAASVPTVDWLRLSAESEASLDRLRHFWADHLEAIPPAQWPAHTKAAAHRSALSFRCAVPLAAQTPQLLRSGDADGGVTHKVGYKKTRAVFAFAGNGAQHAVMGRDAYAQDSVYRASFDETAAAFASLGYAGLTECLSCDDLETRLQSPLVAQTMLFSCQIAQARSLMSLGVNPEGVVGHSLGEIAALHIAGAFDLHDAAKIILRRSARFEQMRGRGGMLAVAASEASVRQMLGGFDDTIGIAAVNSPVSVTVSGPNEMLERFARATLHGKRVAMVRLAVDIAYHSAGLEVQADAFRQDLADIEFHPLTRPVAGAAVGRMLRRTEVDAAYLWRNTRAPVQFQNAVEALSKEQASLLVEIAPKPVLAAYVRDIARFSSSAVDHCVPPEPDADVERYAASCWVQGIAIPPPPADLQTEPPLPGYPWDEQEHFSAMSPDGFDVWGEFSDHCLAGRRMDRDTAVWVGEFTPTEPAWTADHVIGGDTILPAAALFEIVLSAGATLWQGAALELSECDILQPADLGKEGLRIRTEIDVQTGAVTLSMRPRLTSGGWSILARATLRRTTAQLKTKLPRKLAWSDIPAGFYGTLGDAGLQYGPEFQTLKATALRGSKTIYCQLGDGLGVRGIYLDPAQLDGAFHSLALWAQDFAPELATQALLVPNRVGKLVWNGAHHAVQYASVTITALRTRSLCADVTLFDAAGTGVAQLEGVEFALLPNSFADKLKPRHWQRRHTKWRALDEAVTWPRSWTKPDKTLGTLGLTREPPLLPDHARLVRLREAIGSAGPVDTLIHETLRDAPDLANDIRDLLIRENGAPDYAITQNTAAHRAIWRVASRLVGALVGSWPARERLNIAVIGLVDPVVVTQWMTSRAVDDLILSGANPSQHAFLSAGLRADLLPRLRPRIDAGQADLIVVIDGADRVDETYLAACAARGAMVLHLDTRNSEATEPEGMAKDGPGLWYADAGGLCVQVRIERSDHSHTATAPMVCLTAGQSWPIPVLGQFQGETGVGTRVHRHRAGDSAGTSLTRLLMRLKPFHNSKNRPRLLLVWNEGGAEFEAFARAIGTVLRSLRNEVPDWDISAIVVEAAPPDTLWPALLDTALREPVVHVRGPDVRLERIDAMSHEQAGGPSTCLVMPPTVGRAPEWRPAKRPTPRAGEIEIEVVATGLNFRDVLWAQGRVPDRLFDIGASPPSMGMECAGRVSRVGPDTQMTVGERVMMFAPSAFRTHVVAREDQVTRVPDEVTLAAAAAIPVAFATAWESLHQLARLEAGQSVLIHGAAGGVGMAAVQIARSLGAEVFATAGTQDKRDLVRAMGARAVFDSRDTGFADQVMQASQGRGVDVVLNSLSGAAMERSIACLAPFGRFVELGKRDILESSRMNLRPFLRNLSYFAYDLDQRLASDPAGVRETMTALAREFASGALTPLPVTSYTSGAIQDAIGDMQAARHVGKIVVTPPRPVPRRRPRKVSGAWVIIGGTGGVGLALASALHHVGAREIHLVSRSGALQLGSGPEGDWAKADPSVTFHTCDASDAQALGALLDRIGPVLGVIHAAMTLRDRMLKDLDAVETGIVIGSKLGVAEALDLALRAQDDGPEHVVLLSSVAAYLGNHGQISYAAANAALEGIAERRRRDGLPATVVGLGPVRDRGVLAQDSSKSRPIDRLEGIEFLTIQQAVAAVLEVITHPRQSDLLYAALDWRALVPAFPALSEPSFDWLLTEAARTQKTAHDLASEIIAAPWPAALTLVQAGLNEALCTILKIPMDQFEPRKPLSRYGVDSLMAMELKLEVDQRFGVALPPAALTETASTVDLAVTLARSIREDDE